MVGLGARRRREEDVDLHRRAKEMVRQQLKQWDYQLEPSLRREVERIYARAERELPG